MAQTEAEKLKLPKGHEGGVVVKSRLLKNGDIRVWYNPSETHNLVIGTTGSGKTQAYVLPSILSIGNTEGSMIINDPKGELASLTSEYLTKLGYKVYIMDYFKPEAGTCFNQLFMVEQEYEKGLPHHFKEKAIDAILKAIEIITSGGSINNLQFFDVVTLKGSKDQQPSDIQEDLVTVWRTKRFTEGGFKTSAVTNALIVNKDSKIYNSNLSKLQIADVETLTNLLHEIFARIFESIQSNYNTKKSGALSDPLYNNEYLKVKQERTVHAAVEVLNTISKENVVNYYTVKIKQNQAVVNSQDPRTKAYANSSELIKRYTEILNNLQIDGLTIPITIAFLKDCQYDHQIAWEDCESNAATYSGSIAKMLVGREENHTGDQFWTQTATALQKGLIMLVCREAYQEYSKHLASCDRILSNMTQPFSTNVQRTKIDFLTDRLLPDDAIKEQFSTVRMAPDKTKSSILSSGDVATKIFSNKSVADQAARHDFDPLQLVEEKSAVFLVSPGNDDSGTAQFTILSTLFIEETYSALNRYLSETKKQKLPRPVYFLLDELANIPPIPNLGSKISLARSKNMRFSIVLQSYEQLKSLYRESCETIKENSQIIYLLSNNIGTAEEISKRIGKQTIEINSFSHSSKDGASVNTNTSEMGRELYTAQELIQLKPGTAIYLMQRQQPYETHYEMAYQWPIWKWLQDNQVPNVHIRRNRQPVNYFCPDDVNDFTIAYESLEKNTILDSFLYSIFSAIGKNQQHTAEENTREKDIDDEEIDDPETPEGI